MDDLLQMWQWHKELCLSIIKCIYPYPLKSAVPRHAAIICSKGQRSSFDYNHDGIKVAVKMYPRIRVYRRRMVLKKVVQGRDLVDDHSAEMRIYIITRDSRETT